MGRGREEEKREGREREPGEGSVTEMPGLLGEAQELERFRVEGGAKRSREEPGLYNSACNAQRASMGMLNRNHG